MNNKSKIIYGKVSWIILVIFVFSLLYISKEIKTIASEGSITSEAVTTNNSNIGIELTSEKNIALSLNQKTTIEYKVTPKPINTKIDDVVFVVDLSQNMKEQQDQTEDGMGSRNSLAELVLQKLKGDSNIDGNLNVGVIGYNSSVYELKKGGTNFFVKKSEMNNDTISPIKSKTNESSVPKDRNIGLALKLANQRLQEQIVGNGDTKRNQEIIMITSGLPTYTDDQISGIKNNGYKIVTIDISNDKNNNTTATTTNDYNSSDSIKIMELHNKLANVSLTKGYDYIIGQYEPNSLNYANFGALTYENVYGKLFNALIQGTSMSDAKCTFSNIQLNFGANNNFVVGDKATINLKNGRNITVDIVQSNGMTIIKLPDECVKYIRDTNDYSFKADSFTISFEVTPKVSGNDLQFGRNATGNLISNLTYTQNIAGEESSETVIVPTPSITVSDLNPQIGTPALVSPNPNPTTANIGDNINVKYNFAINPGTAVYSKIQPSQINEVLFLVDVSKNMKTQARITYFQNGICNQILNSTKLKANNLKVGIIGMKEGDPMLVRGTGEAQKYNGKDLSNVNLLNINESGDINDIVQQRAKQTESIINNSTWDTPNVMSALTKADDILQAENGNNKAIVLIVSQDFQYDESKLTDLKNRGYKIIIMDISYNGTKNVAQENLNKLYNFLNGYGDNCMLGKYVSQTDTNYNSADYDCNKIELALSNGMNDKSYKLKNLKFNFNLGEGFYPVNNSTSISYSTTANDSTTINNITGNDFQRETSLGNNRYSLIIPDIEFKCEIVENPCKDDASKIKVKYTPNINNQPVDGGSFSVNFNVNFVKYTSDNPVVFGTKDTVSTNNYFSYNNINQALVSPIYIRTPSIKGILNIVHGIYAGKVQGEQKIDDTNANNTFSKGCAVTMAAKFEITAESKLQLNLDKDLSAMGVPKVYKILDNGELKLLGEMDLSNQYTVNESDKGNIIVIYSVKLPENKEDIYTNTIKVGEESKDAIIKTGIEDLPDLF